ncbi:MAG: hypothetical protein LCH89_15725 [Proteobacteria bacterium]|jgi:hypothetical protein|nr:hypothetical protein [Pseudomonadota bacterium]
MNLDDETVGLAVRREQLLLRSSQLRERLSARSQAFRPAFGVAERLRDGVEVVRQNRALVLLVGAAALGAVAVRPRAALSLGLRAWSGWQMFKRVQPVVHSFLRQLL